MNVQALREQRKKLLVVEGAVHRFELVQARRAFEAPAMIASPASGALPLMLRLVRWRRYLPLITTALPLLFGEGRAARWLRRGALVAGTVALVLAVTRRWSARPASPTAAAESSSASFPDT